MRELYFKYSKKYGKLNNCFRQAKQERKVVNATKKSLLFEGEIEKIAQCI